MLTIRHYVVVQFLKSFTRWKSKSIAGAAGRLLALGVLGVLGTLIGTAANAHSIPLSAEELVRRSPDVVVATALGVAPRWNAQRNLIQTVVELRVEEVLRGDRLVEDTFSVVIAGGTLDGQTHDTCVSVQLEPGVRYLLFLQPAGAGGFTPFTGGHQGVLRETADGGFAPGAPGAPAAGPSFAALVDSVRLLVATVEATPAAPARPRAATGMPTYEKIYDPSSTTGVATGAAPLAASAVALPGLPSMPPTPEGAAATVQTPGETSSYTIQRWPPPPIVFNPLPLHWVWSPHDQWMMSYWNEYAGTLFQVMQPTGTWAWQNNRFDLAGFPTNATMIAQFGEGWGTDTLAICYTRWIGSGSIIEADIAFNPAFAWTLDNEFGTRDDNEVWGFDQSMLHELAHAFGLKHPWQFADVWWDSVMNYSPKQYRLPVQHADDTAGVRWGYGGPIRRDGLVSFYRTMDSSTSTDAFYVEAAINPTNVAYGQTFSITGAGINNPGTVTLVDPVVEVYVTPNRLDWAGYRFLASRTLSLTLATHGYATFNLTGIPVPGDLPEGTYYVALFLRDGADSIQRNNSAWSKHLHTLTVQAACSPGWSLSCPQSSDFWANNGSGSTDVLDGYSCSGVDASGPEYAYQVTVPSGQLAKVRLTELEDDLDLFLLSGTSCTGGSCAGSSTNGGITDEELYILPLFGNDFRVVVDGFAGAVSNYRIELSCDILFSNDFESGDTSGWASTVDPAGSLAVTPAAALAGSYGLAADLAAGGSRFVEVDWLQQEPRLRARFHLDPNGWQPAANGQRFKVLQLLSTVPDQKRLVTAVLRSLNGQYLMLLKVRQSDDSIVNTGWVPLTDEPHVLELAWTEASGLGAADGTIALWVDGTLAASRADLVNNGRRVGAIRLGAMGVNAGTTGTIYLDRFEAREATAIGP